MPALTRTERTLGSEWYLSPVIFEAEIETIWYRDWICVGRLDELPATGDFFTTSIGTQNLIVLRAADDTIRAFHNTCRHRGSRICTHDNGRFRNGRIVCPYHTWTYSLEGSLLATPHRQPCDGFSNDDYPLYRVAADTWGGFVFVKLAESPPQSLADWMGEEAENLRHWPLAEMVSVRREVMSLACNWKIFWENYCECYHCPRVHPELCRLVPAYRQGVMDSTDLPDWQGDGDDDAPPALAEGMVTWSDSGQAALPVMDGLSDAERKAGATFASFTASMFVVAHPDYVRSVRIVPVAPGSTRLIVDWLLLPEVAESHADRIDEMTRFGRRVVEQDGAVCELNQQGLRCMRHAHGVLVPQEHYLHAFHAWVRSRVGDRLE